MENIINRKLNTSKSLKDNTISKSGITIRELRETDNVTVQKMVYWGIWWLDTHRLALCLIKSKTSIALQIFAFLVLHTTFGGFAIPLLLIILILILVYLAISSYMYYFEFSKEPTTLDIRTNMFTYWVRPDVPTMRMWVAEEDAHIVGTIAVRPTHLIGFPANKQNLDLDKPMKTATVERMFVAESHRGKGIATALKQKAIEFCRRYRYKEIRITTSSMLHESVCFYKNMGFQVERCYPFCYGYVTVFDFKRDL